MDKMQPHCGDKAEFIKMAGTAFQSPAIELLSTSSLPVGWRAATST